jgi:hypothetical protein
MTEEARTKDSERRLRRWARELPALAFAHDDVEHRRDQSGVIDASSARFDDGVRAEAKRLAIAVRVLVRDSELSRGLLSRMGATAFLPWADGTVPGGPRAVRLVREHGVAPVGSLLTVIPHGARTWEPAFNQVPIGPLRVGFPYWWGAPRIFDTHGTEASRSNVVLWLAHHDGGAHVGDLPADYRAIAKESSVGTFFSRMGGSNIDDSPVPAAMRQIAEELRYTIRTAFAGVVDFDQPRSLMSGHADVDQAGQAGLNDVRPRGSDAWQPHTPVA